MLILCAWPGPADSVAQKSHLFDASTFQNPSLHLGYNYNFGGWDAHDIINSRLHLIELGIWQTRYTTHPHPVSMAYYVSNELSLNSSRFVYGPKFGGLISFWLFIVGTELAYYTNFSGGSLRLIPYFGFGTHILKLTIHPHLILTNKQFGDIHAGHINLTVKLIDFRKRKVTTK